MPESISKYIQENCQDPVDPNLIKDLESALNQQFSEHLKASEDIKVSAYSGKGCAQVSVLVGDEHAAHQFDFFCADIEGEGLDGALGLVIDFAQGALEEFFNSNKEAKFPLDFTKRVFDGQQIYARYEYRNFAVEKLANNFLR